MGLLASPKQPQAASKREWYAYYAGYRSEFVSDVLTHVMSDAGNVYDPWNGSGTTSTTAALLGLKATGIDVNPAMSMIALARQTPSMVADSAGPIARKLIATGVAWRNVVDPQITNIDLLSNWFDRSSIVQIRCIQAAIHEMLIEPGIPEIRAHDIGETSHLGAFFYCALFDTVRTLLRGFRTSNPTWIKVATDGTQRLSILPEQLHEHFLAAVDRLKERLTITTDAQLSSVEIFTANAENTSLPAGKFDACLTSPPYCTRIDYVRSSLPELAVLNISQLQVDELRKASTGTPVVKDRGQDACMASAYIVDLLAAVKAHPTKGSAYYYEPWMRKYFVSMHRSLAEVVRVVRSGSPIGLVVQNSRYKEVEVDLQRALTEIMEDLGRSIIERVDFDVIHLRSNMNPKSRLHAPVKAATEAIMVFG